MTQAVSLATIRHKVLSGQRITDDDALFLFESPDLLEIGALADVVNRRRNRGRVFFNLNRHINPTNICALSCKFCSFSRKPGEEGSYAFSIEEMVAKAGDAVREGATEVHMVGGLHPRWSFRHYLDMIAALKAAYPSLHLKAFTAVELDWMARRDRRSIRDILSDLKAAGLGSMPGGGAEIFHPEVRDVICDTKVSADQWIDTHRLAHSMGLRSNATMLYGHIEKHVHRVDHMRRLRELQDETHGFSAFIPLSFQPLGNDIGKDRYTNGFDDLKTVAVARLYLDNFSHIKAYWVMLGQDIAEVALRFGANDLDGTVREERISRMAGGRSGVVLDRGEIESLIERAGFEPVERDTLYHPVQRHADGTVVPWPDEVSLPYELRPWPAEDGYRRLAFARDTWQAWLLTSEGIETSGEGWSGAAKVLLQMLETSDGSNRDRTLSTLDWGRVAAQSRSPVAFSRAVWIKDADVVAGTWRDSLAAVCQETDATVVVLAPEPGGARFAQWRETIRAVKDMFPRATAEWRGLDFAQELAKSAGMAIDDLLKDFAQAGLDVASESGTVGAALAQVDIHARIALHERAHLADLATHAFFRAPLDNDSSWRATVADLVQFALLAQRRPGLSAVRLGGQESGGPSRQVGTSPWLKACALARVVLPSSVSVVAPMSEIPVWARRGEMTTSAYRVLSGRPQAPLRMDPAMKLAPVASLWGAGCLGQVATSTDGEDLARELADAGIEAALVDGRGFRWDGGIVPHRHEGAMNWDLT